MSSICYLRLLEPLQQHRDPVWRRKAPQAGLRLFCTLLAGGTTVLDTTQVRATHRQVHVRRCSRGDRSPQRGGSSEASSTGLERSPMRSLYTTYAESTWAFTIRCTSRSSAWSTTGDNLIIWEAVAAGVLVPATMLARAWSSFKSIALCCLARFSCVGRASATNIHRLAFKAKLGHSSNGRRHFWIVDLKSCSEMAVIMRVLVNVLAPYKVSSPAKSSSSSKSTSGLHHDASDTRGFR